MEQLGFASSSGCTSWKWRSGWGRGPGHPGWAEGRGGALTLWPPPRENAENMYYFSELALTLNEREEGVAPTDSRLRPDQRLMEKGHWDEANTEKQRLEEKQRLSRRRRLEACSRGCTVEDGEARRGGGSAPRRGNGVPGFRPVGSQWAREAATCPPAHCARPAEKEADVYTPLWFEKRLDPLTGETACVYKGGYWETKEKQDWHMCPDIF